MIFKVCLFFLVNIFSYTINARPHERFSPQLNAHRKDALPYVGWAGGTNNPSGAISGAYYGSGANPNYGLIGPNANDAGNGVAAISYNSNWNQQQQQQPYYGYNNNNNNWQTSNMNGYYKQPYNPYLPGSQEWYPPGVNFWYNKGQSLIPHAWSLIISILISIICI